MAKGIPGFVIPFGSMFFISIFTKKFKEIFKPQYFIIGFILFFAITLPWHIIMLKMHDPLFFNEYIIKHHIARFMGGNELGREQPFYYYFITILWGFFPWILSTLAVLARKITKRDFVFKNLNNIQLFMVFNGIIALFTIAFFSSSDTKLVTYILPIYGSLACLGGYIWTNYIEKGEYARIINATIYILGYIFIFASIIAIFTPLFLPAQLNTDIAEAKALCIFLLFFTGIISIYFTKKELYIGVFFTYVLFMLALSAFGTGKFFNIDYKFGQNDLLKYAKYAKEHNKTITTYKFSHKYSLIYYGEKPVEYGLNYDINDLKQALEKDNNLVIIQHKKLDNDVKNLDYNIVADGRKYILIEKNIK